MGRVRQRYTQRNTDHAFSLFETVNCRGETNKIRCAFVIRGLSVRDGRKEGSVLFNDALNTFYLRLYGVTHMVKDYSDSERGNPLPPHGLLFPISSKGYFISIIPQKGQHIPRPLLHQSWSTGLNDKIAQWVHHVGSIRRPIAS